MERDRVKAYGVELEGAWQDQPTGFIHDGSVCIYDYDWAGEVPSPPLPNLDAVYRWISRNYPYYVNESCGMHVHMSFKSLADYALLLDTPKFQDHLVDGLRVWAEGMFDNYHPIFDRLNGFNEYCELEWRAERQMQLAHKDGSRYSVVNFCWKLHKTVEIRVLPAFDNHDEAFYAIREVSRLVNTWLKKHRPRKLPKVVEKLVMPSRMTHRNTEAVNELSRVITNQKLDTLVKGVSTNLEEKIHVCSNRSS